MYQPESFVPAFNSKMESKILQHFERNQRISNLIHLLSWGEMQ